MRTTSLPTSAHRVSSVLAELNPAATWCGKLEINLEPGWSVNFLAFVYSRLPEWRDDPERQHESSEIRLTSQLCVYLGSVCREEGWDFLQLNVEHPDERVRGRSLDLVASPSGVTIYVEGRKYTHYEPLLPIECKRLPTPPGPRRDNREYLFNSASSTGGIQRFKAGNHSSVHTRAAMIGYIQSHTAEHWVKQIAQWIRELAGSEPDWQRSDGLTLLNNDEKSGVAMLKSTHNRRGGLSPIGLRHLWVVMTASRAARSD